MSTLASLLIELGIDTGRLQGDLGKANRQVESAFAGMSRSADKLGSALGAITGSAIVGTMVAASRAAMEGEQAINRLDAVVRATGNAAGFTREQLHALADGMAETTQFDDESIRNATASLLKFGNMHGKVLQDALRLSADYAALTGGDMTSAAETLGRAIASPAQGVERLQRSIGYLNPATVESIKHMQEMGDTAGAQARLLEELQSRIGGVAEAMNTGYTKAFGDAKKATGEFFEALGNTGPVQATVQSFLGFTTDSFRDLKHIIEDGDWFQAFKFVLGFRQTAEQAAARRPSTPVQPSGASEPYSMQDLMAMADVERRERAGLQAVYTKLELEKRAQAKKTADEILAYNERMRDLDLKGWVALASHLADPGGVFDQENLATANLNQEIYDFKDELRKMELDGQEWLSKNKIRVLGEEKEEMQRIAERNARIQAELFASTWDDLASRGANFFVDLASNGREAFGRLGDSIENFGRELLLIFGKRWILQVGAALTGSAALGVQAGQVGQGTLAGSFADGLGGLGALLPGGEIGAAVGNFASMGASMFGAGGSLATTIGSVASFLPALGAAVGVASLIYQAFNDGPENPNFRWLQGTGGQGLFGGVSTEGNYGFDSTGLSRVIGGLDARFAAILGPGGVSAATAGLAGYTQAGLRMDGTQPAQFAFPEGTDREAAEQLAKELLQSRYGIIFDQIDKTIADTIKGWSGTSAELQTYIETALGVIEGLAGLNITGLNVSTLQAMQREGEGLGETFTRVAGQWGQFNEMFTTEAERLTSAQNQITSTFASLGIAIPSSNDEFEKLVRGLDLSTEAGRNMFNALMQVAPAFNTVSQASAALVNDFNSIMVQLRGQSYQSTLDAAQLEQATRQFMALNSWASGMDWRYVAQQILTITPEDYAAYGSYGNASQSLINDILRLQIPRQGSGSSYTPISYTPTGYDDSARALEELRRAAEQAAEALQRTKDGIMEWLSGVLLSDLSPMVPLERLGFAQDAYVENLMKAQSGDLGALSNYTNLADAYLKEARSYYASSPEYTSIFAAVTEQAGKLAGLQDARPLTSADAARNAASIVQAIEDLKRAVERGTIAEGRLMIDQTRAIMSTGSDLGF